MNDDPLTFVTIKWGVKYSADYVNILHDMVRRNLPPDFPFTFLCYTDGPSGLLAGIEARPLPAGLIGWWNKLYLFKQGVCPEGARMFFLDLDTAIVGGLGDIAAYDGEFALLRDFYNTACFNSSIMSWRGGFGHFIWQSYDDAGRPDISGGDQAWIDRCKPRAAILQDLFPGAFASFKQKAIMELPSGVRVVCFHGLPRPHQVKNGWVEQVWRIGGGAPAAEPAPRAAEQPIENVRHALALPFPWLEQPQPFDSTRRVCIVGSGASVGDFIEELKTRQQEGHKIWAINGVFQHLAGEGITADAQIMSASNAANSGYVPDRTEATLYYASQCHPDVFEKASLPPKRVVVWHPLIDGIRNLTGSRDAVFIGSGGTTGMKAIGLAQALGFGHIHLYGYDSSLAAGSIAPVDEAANDEDRRIDVTVDGRSFASSPRLAQQINDFRVLKQALMNKGVGLSVHGDGLLPYVARKLARL